MKQTQLRYRNALFAGVTVASLEAILILLADPNISVWILTQSVLFWFSCGVTVSLSDTGLPRLFHSILLTELLNLPWFIVLVIIPGHYSHLVPLVVASLIFGAVIGLLDKILRTPVAQI